MVKPSPEFGISDAITQSIDQLLGWTEKPVTLQKNVPKRPFKYQDLLDTVDRKDFAQWMYDKLVDEEIINPDSLLDYTSTRDWEFLTREEFKARIEGYKAEKGIKK